MMRRSYRQSIETQARVIGSLCVMILLVSCTRLNQLDSRRGPADDLVIFEVREGSSGDLLGDVEVSIITDRAEEVSLGTTAADGRILIPVRDLNRYQAGIIRFSKAFCIDHYIRWDREAQRRDIIEITLERARFERPLEIS